MHSITKFMAGMTAVGVLCGTAYLASCGEQDPQDIRDILGDSEPHADWLYDDWKLAQKTAEKEGKPLFALFRCVP